ncbi:receptor-transporting protein 2-like [Notolabrus celidotus]|uniref:receptor-transporting protein 2-like n=1 Tax=Notolabrus celidotus TaxID=1203425 RepID=UPI00148FDC30|nr:receptor-transporting protein 2-like [Notolabrus celidotus]XP_034534693.1 receptor-transporting protein 2-like [Notolabrus celidotus]XP_034534694.1 receptor-transporting protein 2-like [Notolabrus celidotus]XP_034534696.1 receptor-transporting protein 2-like [Notolabrus celidotus]XP_034534697.1 receptor-transporting protein 2-like [Notolabrus celidotus]
MNHSEWTRIFGQKTGELKDSWRLEFDDKLVPKSPNKGWKMTVRSTCARFRCSKCGRTWASNKAMVVFHMRLSYGQGIAKAKALHQKCKTCDEGPMQEPIMSRGNIAILLENLVEQIRVKCYNEDMGKKSRHFRSFDAKSPHEPAHCEGCKLGICPKSR